MDEREMKLPVWARELIADLRLRLKASHEPLIKELSELRPQVAKLKAKNSALQELLSAAASGGHVTASQIMGIIEAYEPWKE